MAAFFIPGLRHDILGDPTQGYNTAAAGAQKAAQQFAQLSNQAWGRSMGGTASALSSFNGYNSLFDKIYGTNTSANAQKQQDYFGMLAANASRSAPPAAAPPSAPSAPSPDPSTASVANGWSGQPSPDNGYNPVYVGPPAPVAAVQPSPDNGYSTGPAPGSTPLQAPVQQGHPLAGLAVRMMGPRR